MNTQPQSCLTNKTPAVIIVTPSGDAHIRSYPSMKAVDTASAAKPQPVIIVGPGGDSRIAAL